MRKTGEILAAYRKKKHMSQIMLTKELEKYGYTISNQAVSKWERGGSEPGASLLMALCRILDIKNPVFEYFGEDSGDAFSQLNTEGREKVLEYTQLLADSGKFRKAVRGDSSFRRMIRLYMLPVSAGKGEFLEDENFSEIEVGSEVPASANFGLYVRGDSMTPQFVDGQVIWIRQQDVLSEGEIGIFGLNGNAYIKKLVRNADGTFLLSLNTSYEPIPVRDEDSFRIFGKVVG